MTLRKPVLFTLLEELLDAEFAFRILGCNTFQTSLEVVEIFTSRISKERIDLLKVEIGLLADNGLKAQY
jgi:hypothetical protein